MSNLNLLLCTSFPYTSGRKLGRNEHWSSRKLLYGRPELTGVGRDEINYGYSEAVKITKS